MRKIHALAVLLILVLWSTTALAQKQYTTWYFGFGLGLDFKSSPPTLLTDGQTQIDEGSAVYCDPETGKLLFYTAGGIVWDRQHRVMPNGSGLSSGFSSTQAALIVPDPGDQNRFYIFHTDHIDPNGDLTSGLSYSICDMRLNNGFGDVTLKNVELLSHTTEKLTAVQLCNDQLFWIITHEKNNNAFIAWRLDESGISAQPVRSQIGDTHGPVYLNWIGYLAASPNGAMLASAVGSSSIELFRFNSLTGQVHDPIRLPRDAGSGYGVSFSPDNTKVYVGGSGWITQYDITSWDNATIATTAHRLPADLSTNAIKLGPDGKLYTQNGSHIGVIHKPNLSGNACEYVPRAFFERNQLSLGLPNNIDALGYKCRPRVRIDHASTICEGSCTSFTDSSRHNPTKFLWTFEGAIPSASTSENPTNICYSKAGTYTVKLVASNEFGSDSITSTIDVKACTIPKIMLRDTTVCISECLIFRDTSSVSTRTEWQFTEGTPSSYTGKTPPPICYYRPGRYPVQAIASNGYGADTAVAYVTVEDCNLPVASFIHDTVICAGSTLALTDRSRNNVSSREWTFEGGEPGSSTEKNPRDIVFSQVGLYEIRLIVSNTSGSDTAFSKVRVIECHPPVATLRDYDICQGDCIYLEDSSTNAPTSWEWQLEGITPGLNTSSKPGQICYETPGRFSIQLISRNTSGADTVRSNVLVRPATGYTTASLDFSEALDACGFIDTFFWVYAGCMNNLFNQLRSDDPNILLPSATVTIRANDSLKVAARIAANTPGTFNSTISFTLNGESISLPCNYIVEPDKEKFQLSTIETDFITTHCDALIRELTITNAACGEQEISRIYLDANVTPFSVTYDQNSLRLAAKQSLKVTITYDPTSTGDNEPDLIIETATGIKHTCALRGIRNPIPEMTLGIRSQTHNAVAGDEIGVELVFETAVGDTVLPSVIDITLDYNTDMLSSSEITPMNGWILNSMNEGNGKLKVKLSRLQNTSISPGELLTALTFKTFLAKEDSALITLSSIICDPDNARFATCVLAAGHTGSGSVHVGALCGNELLRETLGKQKQLGVIVQPNPISSNEKLSVFVNTASVGEILVLDLVDLSGKRVELQSTLVRAAEEHMKIALPSLPSGSYTLRATIGGEQVSQQIVIY